jgi:hypothetical protein
VANLQWNGPQFLMLLKAELGKRIYAATISVTNKAKQLLSVPGTASAGKGKRLIYGAQRSKPGEPPRKQMGRLRASVAQELGEEGGEPAGRAGTNIAYGRALELGVQEVRSQAFGKKTKPYVWRLLARPWLRRSLTEMTPFIRSLMSRPWKP